MMHLLKIEWLKIKNYRTFWIFMALYVVGLFSINYIAYQFQVEMTKQTPLNIFPYDFPRVWGTIGWISSFLLYFPGMLMILFITNEYTYKTHRQNVVDGWTRAQFVFAKIGVAVTLALVITIIVAINAAVFGVMSGNSFKWEGFDKIFYAFIQALSHLFLAMIVAVFVRRGALSIAIYFLYGLVLEQIIGAILTNYDLGRAWYYFPLQTADELVPLPFGNEFLNRPVPSEPVLLTFALLYITLFAFFAVRKFQTADL